MAQSVEERRAKDTLRHRQRAAADPERKRAEEREWHARNKDRKAAKVRARRKTHLEEVRLQARIRNTKNPVKRQQQARLRRAAHREAINAKKRAAWAENAEEINAKNRAKRAADPERMRQKQRDYYQKNRKRLLEQAREKRRANLDAAHIKERIYRQNHPEIFLERNRRRRAQKNNDPINDLSPAQWQEILVAKNFRCEYCPDPCKLCRRKAHKLTPDHVTPYTHQGSNTLWNVVPACSRCNSKKGNRPPMKAVQPLLLTVAAARKKKAS
jgi:5-methylcytosine-specific restriction endonuclease McrA